MGTRLKRVEQTERNRERVLAAARDVLLRRGYHAASVDEIAEAAGFSRGVVYSQFGGKADLLLALLEIRIAELAEHVRSVAAGRAGPEGVRALTEDGESEPIRDVGWLLLLIEFRVHAARHPDLAERYAALHERAIGELAHTLAGIYARGAVDPPQPVRALAQAMFGISTGLTLERLADPGALGEAVDLFAPVFGAGARRTAPPAGATSRRHDGPADHESEEHMGRPENEACVRRHLIAETGHDMEATLATLHPECVFVDDQLGRRWHGHDGARRHYEMWWSAFGVTPQHGRLHWAADDLAIGEAVFAGRHVGPFAGLEPTGRPLELPFVVFVTFADGLVSGERFVYDLNTALRQLDEPAFEPAEVG
jgi:AcrR family transcriptional regulator